MSRILIADDNTMVRTTVRIILASAGHQVLEAATGVEALKLVFDERPDLLLLDYMMPGLDGLQLLRALRGEPSLATLPAVLFTARIGDLEPGVAEELRVERLSKPVKSRELLSLIETLLRRGNPAPV